LPKLLRVAVRLVAAALLLGEARPARAAFEFPPAGAQAAAMGGSILAGSRDGASLFLDPSGVAGLDRPEAYFTYNRFYTGLRDVSGGLGQGFAAVGIPLRRGKAGSLAVGYGDLQAYGLLHERVFGVAYARRWRDSFEGGVTAKYLHHRYLIAGDPAASGDPVFAGGTARGAFAFDAGVRAEVLGPVVTAGLAVRNINRPDVGLESEDRVPREVQGALSYNAASWGLRMTADFLYRDAASGTIREKSVPGLGLEKTLEGGRAKFRLGATLDQFSGGGGIQFDRLGFDYAFVLTRNLVANNAGTHIIGVRYRFGGAPSAPPPAATPPHAAPAGPLSPP